MGREKFKKTLTENYRFLFENDEEYTYVRKRNTPEGFAALMTQALAEGIADKNGKAIKLTCKQLKIKHTYKAIKEYLV